MNLFAPRLIGLLCAIAVSATTVSSSVYAGSRLVSVEENDNVEVKETVSYLAYNTVESTGKKNVPLFMDGFEYHIARDNENGRRIFIDNGWSGAKAVNLTGSHAGYLYTVDRIPGYTGKFPGKNSKYVLAVEGRPSLFNTQTDFWLQYGYGKGGDKIPGDVWFQFWMYINYYDDPKDKEDQLSHFGMKGKIIYPTKEGYPTRSGLWMLGCCSFSYEPYGKDLGDATTDIYMHLADYEYMNVQHRSGKRRWKIGQTDLSERIGPNKWILVKLHIDTSTTSGKYEQWLKPLGGEWTKTAEWIDGVTPFFEWKIPASEVGGHRAFRMPTTFNNCRKRNKNCDFWLYIDDFVMSDSEASLPKYE